MSTVCLRWNVERDACAISWSYKPSVLPLDPVNSALAQFYNNNLHPFIYEAWDGSVAKGLLLADSMELSNDEIFALFNQIQESHASAPQKGEWAEQTFNL